MDDPDYRLCTADFVARGNIALVKAESRSFCGPRCSFPSSSCTYLGIYLFALQQQCQLLVRKSRAEQRPGCRLGRWWRWWLWSDCVSLCQAPHQLVSTSGVMVGAWVCVRTWTKCVRQSIVRSTYAHILFSNNQPDAPKSRHFGGEYVVNRRRKTIDLIMEKARYNVSTVDARWTCNSTPSGKQRPKLPSLRDWHPIAKARHPKGGLKVHATQPPSHTPLFATGPSVDGFGLCRSGHVDGTWYCGLV